MLYTITVNVASDVVSCQVDEFDTAVMAGDHSSHRLPVILIEHFEMTAYVPHPPHPINAQPTALVSSYCRAVED